MYDTPSFVLDLFGLIITVLLYVGNLTQSKKTYARTLFAALTILLSVMLITDAMASIMNGSDYRGAHLSHEIACFVNFLLAPVFCWTWLVYTDYWLESSDERLAVRQYIYGIPMVAGIVLILVNFNTGSVYNIDAANVYSRGTFFFYNQIIYAVYIGYATVLALYHADKEPNKEKKRRFRCIALFMILPVFALFAQNILPPGPSIICPALSISLLMVYINIQQQRTVAQELTTQRQEQHAAMLENELMQNRISIMLSQIQPHFLYNSLTTIVDLCDTDAKLAKRATIAFSQYLRGNMDSLRQTMPVPFPVEQKHVENYLWLEKLRFGDELNIVWDIQVKDFKLPSLSVQPLVENAVKYGVGKKPGGGTVTISTRELQHVYTVTVQDDGVGYNVMETQPDGRTHIGIDNVRSRLHFMCGGALTIQSETGKGTTATITLLKEENT